MTLATSSLLCGSVVAGETPVVTENKKFEGSVSAGYHSQYLWRGMSLGDDLVDLAVDFEGACPLSSLDLSAGAWYGSVNNGPDDGESYDELDLFVEASKEFNFGSVSVGYIFYHFFGDADDAQELYVGWSKEFYGIETSLNYFWDIETDNQGYTEAAFAKSCDLFGFGLDAAVTAGYLLEEGALSYVTTQVSHDFTLSETAKITPYVAYTVELDDLERYVPSSEKNELTAGVSLSVSF